MWRDFQKSGRDITGVLLKKERAEHEEKSIQRGANYWDIGAGRSWESG
jgi:hypothetical protein